MQSPDGPRAWPALLTIVLPLAVFAFYAVWVGYLTGDTDWAQLINVKPNPNRVDRFARDAGGRLQFGIASALLQVAALVSIIFAIVVLKQRAAKQAAGILAITVIACAISLATATLLAPNGLSKINVVLETINTALKTDGLPIKVEGVTRYNMVAAIIGIASLLLCFAAATLRTGKDDRSADLRSRMRVLELTTFLAAFLLVLVTAVNKSLADWPQAFLAEPDQKSYAYLAGAIGSFWGVLCSLTLLFALAPAVIGLKLEIDKSAKGQAESWKKENGLEFDTQSGVGAAIAALAHS